MHLPPRLLNEQKSSLPLYSLEVGNEVHIILIKAASRSEIATFSEETKKIIIALSVIFPTVRIVHTHNLLQAQPLSLSCALSSIVILLLFRSFFTIQHAKYTIYNTLIMQSSEHCLQQIEKENLKKIRKNFYVPSYIYTLKIYILLWKPGEYFNSFFPLFRKLIFIPGNLKLNSIIRAKAVNRRWSILTLFKVCNNKVW